MYAVASNRLASVAVACLAAAALLVPMAGVASGQGIEDFYEARGGRPLWFRGGEPSAAIASRSATSKSSRAMSRP